ncbi:MAG: hypothetical protein SH850_23880 [Planctomycetaceae bacterium]|nr:hypothetical protein [Planctomycetaceae bacterium]
MTLGKFIVLLIVGGFAGSLAGRVATFSKTGFGRWINLAVGMVGALVGNLLFWMLHIDLGLGELQVTFQDLIAAFTGSLLCIAIWWGVRWWKSRQEAQG